LETQPGSRFHTGLGVAGEPGADRVSSNVLLKWTGRMQFTGTDSGKRSIGTSTHDPDNHTGVKISDLLLRKARHASSASRCSYASTIEAYFA
jgi:hypothetical protein